MASCGAEMGHIVVGVDGSPQADRALRWAVCEAEVRATSIEIVHCYVTPGGGPVPRAQEHQLAETRLAAVTTRNREVLAHITWSVAAVPVVAVPSSGLVAAAVDAELVVVGARGADGFQRLRLGSTGYRTAAHSMVPVAVISADGGGSEEMDGHRPLVVGVDGSPAARRALHWAIDEAGRRAVPVTVAHAYRSPDPATPEVEAAAREEAAALMRGLEQDVQVDGPDIETVIMRGAPAGGLLALSGNDRLLVVGTRGGGPQRDMPFGSVSHQCLHHACGPVVIVP